MSGSDSITVNTFAFFSEKAAGQHGYSVYAMADGTELNVTAVYSSTEEGMKSYKWDDKKFVGIVDHYVRSVQPLGPPKHIEKEQYPSKEVDEVVEAFIKDFNDAMKKLNSK